MTEDTVDFSSFKHSLYFTVPIIITLIATSLLSIFTMLAYYPKETDIINIAPVEGEGADAGLLNAVIFILLAFVGGIILLYLLRRGLINLIEWGFALIMGYCVFVFTIYFIIPVYWITLGQFIPDPFSWINQAIFTYYLYLIPASISGIFVFVVLAFKRFKSRKVHNFLMIYTGSQLGAMFGIHMPTLTVLIVLLGLSFYDIYAVFWGPLKSIFKPEQEEKQPRKDLPVNNTKGDIGGEKIYPQLNSGESGTVTSKYSSPLRKDSVISLPVYQTSRISIGLGDFVFFSMLIAHSITIGHFQGIFTPFLLAFAGITIGAYITFRLLEKQDILPALPVPVFLGVIGFITGNYILGI